ncbi:MAG: hypothetical protein AAGI13_13440 [Pseudomonadota bacterium]
MLVILLKIVAIFAGIAVGMGALFSIGQAILATGWTRAAHLFALIAILAVMWFLWDGEPGVARLLSPLLVLACLGTFIVERGWFRILPLMQGVFALLVFFGMVSMQ